MNLGKMCNEANNSNTGRHSNNRRNGNCNYNLSVSTKFIKNPQYQLSRKSVRWKSSISIQTDGQIGMTKLIVAFRSYLVNEPKHGTSKPCILYHTELHANIYSYRTIQQEQTPSDSGCSWLVTD
jgi:hypothetical protein